MKKAREDKPLDVARGKGQGRDGFTLIELVMTIVIGSIAVYSVIMIFVNTTSRNAQVDNLSIAVHLASSKIEQVSNKAYLNVSSEALSAFTGQFSNFSSQVLVTNVSSTEIDTSSGTTETGYKKIKVFIITTGSFTSIEVSAMVTDASN
ncbi:MAG: prepilin-type N-terminal cleavage/methylation domain-containing protein [Candidatus Margulisiibacteriota bacterium]